MFDLIIKLINKINPFKKKIKKEVAILHNLKIMEEYKKECFFANMDINEWINMRDGIINEELIDKYFPRDFNKELLYDNNVVVFLIKLVGLMIVSENKPEYDASIIKEINDSFMDKILYGGFSLLDRGRTEIRNAYGEIDYLRLKIKSKVEDKVKLYYILKLLHNVISVIYNKDSENEILVQEYSEKVLHLIYKLYIPNGETFLLKAEELKGYFNYLYFKKHGVNI